MLGGYPVAGGSYQPKSADERAIAISLSPDPVRTVIDEFTVMLMDQGIQLKLARDNIPPTEIMFAWLQELYARGKADGYRLPRDTQLGTDGEPL